LLLLLVVPPQHSRTTGRRDNLQPQCKCEKDHNSHPPPSIQSSKHVPSASLRLRADSMHATKLLHPGTGLPDLKLRRPRKPKMPAQPQTRTPTLAGSSNLLPANRPRQINQIGMYLFDSCFPATRAAAANPPSAPAMAAVRGPAAALYNTPVPSPAITVFSMSSVSL
jgi:hypothetical protein